MKSLSAPPVTEVGAAHALQAVLVRRVRDVHRARSVPAVRHCDSLSATGEQREGDQPPPKIFDTIISTSDGPDLRAMLRLIHSAPIVSLRRYGDKHPKITVDNATRTAAPHLRFAVQRAAQGLDAPQARPAPVRRSGAGSTRGASAHHRPHVHGRVVKVPIRRRAASTSRPGRAQPLRLTAPRGHPRTRPSGAACSTGTILR